ncbi:hypothetical protein F5Y17DRAFT_360361 [Xylariaceae sp. FL0594]|nr:hypothetical protein F5Y17DRAFT_360361 [Xylariaceae sp. FL0594]
MQRVSSLLPSWDRSRSSASSFASNHTRKNSTDKVRTWTDIIPSARSSRLAKEAFWPATLDKECEKAARILRSFCLDGFSVPDERPGSPSTSSSAQSSSRLLKKIPPKLIKNAVGLAVFTSMRSGLWTSGSGGSGVLLARKTDGTWSPPSGLVLQTPGLGFVLGVDIYDCVLLINNFAVLEAFARPKLTLGTDVILSPGPLVSLGLLENDVTWTDLSETAIAYVKARGQVSDAKLDGTILQERSDENERFYGMTLGVAKILSGDINQSLPQVRPLTEMLKAAEGRVDYDMALVEALSYQPAPGDAHIEHLGTPSESPVFGLPSLNDPDPFGVLALEMAGVGIREAGTHLRPESSQFEFHPSPTSPAFPRVKRGSVDTTSALSHRGSFMSSRTVGTEKSHMTDAYAQTLPATPETTPTHSQSQSEDGHVRRSCDDDAQGAQEAKERVSVDYTRIDISALRMLSNFPDLDEPLPEAKASEDDAQVDKANKVTIEGEGGKVENHSPASSPDKEDDGDADDEDGASSVYDQDDDGDDGTDYDEEGDAGDSGDSDDSDGSDFDDELDGDEEAVVFEVATAQAPARVALAGTQVVQAKGAVVNIPKRVPPPLPVRSPARTSRRRSQFPDVGAIMSSPLRQEFDPIEVASNATPRASKILESPDLVMKEAAQAPEILPTVEDTEASPAPEFQERSIKRISAVVSAPPKAEQAGYDGTDHKATITVA